jgi:hypothetical protein
MRSCSSRLIFLIWMFVQLACTGAEVSAREIASPQVALVPVVTNPILLTVKANGSSFEKILETISKRTGILFYLSVDTWGPVTIEFHNLPIEEGLRRLLDGMNFAFFYSEGESNTAKSPIVKLKEVRVLSGSAANGHGQERDTSFSAKVQEPEVTLLGAALVDTNGTSLNQETAEALEGSADDLDAINRLAKSALEDTDPSVREDAAQELGKTWSPEAVDPLAQALAGDQDSFVRRTAAEALGRTWSEAAVDPLSQALMVDPSRWVREYAARALGEIGDTRAVDSLIAALHDTDMSVRESALRSLGAIASIEAGDALYQLALNDSDPWVRASAATLYKFILK